MKLYNVGYLENHDIDREGIILMNNVEKIITNCQICKKKLVKLFSCPGSSPNTSEYTISARSWVLDRSSTKLCTPPRRLFETK